MIDTKFVEDYIKQNKVELDKKYIPKNEPYFYKAKHISKMANYVFKAVKERASKGYFCLSKTHWVLPTKYQHFVIAQHILENLLKINIKFEKNNRSCDKDFAKGSVGYKITWTRNCPLIDIMPEEKYKPSKYSETRKAFFRSLFQYPQHTDITLIVEGKLVKTHKVFLAQCPYFHTMFLGDWKKNHSDEPIPFLEGRYETFLKLLEYLYTGEICKNYFNQSKNCLEMFQLANFLQYEPLQKLSQFYLFQRRNKQYFLEIAKTVINSDLLNRDVETYCRRFLKIYPYFGQEIDLSKLPVRDIVCTFQIGKEFNNESLVEASIAELEKRCLTEANFFSQFQEYCQDRSDKNIEELAKTLENHSVLHHTSKPKREDSNNA